MQHLISSIAGAIVASVVFTSGNAAEFASTTLPQTVLRLGTSAAPTYVREDAGLSARRRTAVITATFAGFTPAAQAAFQRAIDIWETRINSTVPIRVRAQFANLGTTGILGQAGPFTFLGCSSCPAGVVANTWYPVALANKLTRTDNDAANPDINASFNRQFNAWHFGAGPAPAGKIDFTSVVLHELGHGLGFLGAGRLINANQGTVRLGPPQRPTIYDRFTVNAANAKLINLPDPSAALKTQLTSNNLFFRLNNGTRFKIFAPATFQPGSSYSHLNETTFPKGNPNSLMTPFIGRAETIRNPGPITLQIFRQMGWQ